LSKISDYKPSVATAPSCGRPHPPGSTGDR